MLVYPDDFTGDPACLPTKKTELGFSFACEIGHLIESIVVAPLCSSWLTSSVAELARKYGLDCSVRSSVVATRPRRF